MVELVRVESNGSLRAIVKAEGFKDGKKLAVNFEYNYEPEYRLVSIVDDLPLYEYFDDAVIKSIDFID